MIRNVLLQPASLLRAGVLAAAAVALCWPLTVSAGLVAAGVAAALGTLAGEVLSRTRLRLGGAVALSVLVAVVGAGLARGVVSTSLLPALLGPMPAFRLSEAMRWFFLVAPAVFVLRCGTVRYPTLALLEAAAAGLALTATVASHRGGMFHRPLELADWAWSRGIDPVFVLLLLGGAGSFVLAGLLLAEDRKRRVPLHFAVLLLLAVLLALLIRATGVPEPRAAGDLGLTGDPEQDEPQQRSGDRQGARRGGQGEGEPPQGGGGSSNQMSDLPFRNEYSASGGDAPVAVVLLHGDYSPPSGVYYFRQSAFSQFNGRRLVQATRGDVDGDLQQRFPSQRVQIEGAPPASEQRMELQTTIGLLTEHVKPFALDSPVALWPTQNPDRLRFRRAYGALSHVTTLPYEQMFGHRPGRADWTEEQWKHYTSAPSDPRYAALAAQAVEVLKEEYRSDPLAQALGVKLWLDVNGIYSRKSAHANAQDPTGSFLFGDLTGYCVHFAHAAAFLLRSRGVPTRVGAGYAIEESDRAGGSTVLIRGSSAHAWPEIYVEDIGWVVVDLSPERSLDPPGTTPDQTLQQLLGQMLRQSSGEEAEDEPRRPPWISWARAVRVAQLSGLALLLLAGAVKLYRAVVPSFARPRNVYRVSYRSALDRLSEVGYRRAHGESRESFAARVAAIAPSFRGLTAAHMGWALGSRRPAHPEPMRRMPVQVDREISLQVPVWRYLLGRANPFSWLLSR
jgi:protein-glutamine gamma-glutamyltransferase